MWFRFVSWQKIITSNKNDTGPSLRNHGILTASNRDDTTKDFGSRRSSKCTAELGPSHGSSFNRCNGLQGSFRHGGGLGFIRNDIWYACFFWRVGGDGRVTCFGSETADVHVLFHSSTQFFFQHNAGGWVIPKNHDLALCLSLYLARACWSNLSIHLSVYIHLYPSISSSIHLSVHLPIYPCIHLSI